MGRILCVANQKGGVGKTTTAVNLAAGLAMAGNRTLLVDLDPQCNATNGLGLPLAERHPLVSEQPLRESVLNSCVDNLEVLPGSHSFQDIDKLANPEKYPGVSHGATLAQHFATGMAGYDYVLIDCPPSLGPLTQTALSNSTDVLIPMLCDYYSMQGLVQMIDVIRGIIHRQPNRLQLRGIVLANYDHRLELTYEVDREVRDFCGDIVYQTVIPRDEVVSEAPSHGRPVLDYAPRSRGSRAYIELCWEVLERD